MDRARVIIAIFVVFLLCASSAFAIDTSTVPCRTFRTSQDFVKQSTLNCLSKEKKAACLAVAEQRFKSCKYQGNFQKLSRKAHTKLLLLMVLSGSKGTGTLADG